MSQIRGEGKKVHTVEKIYLAFDLEIQFFDGIDQKLRKCIFLKATFFF